MSRHRDDDETATLSRSGVEHASTTDPRTLKERRRELGRTLTALRVRDRTLTQQLGELTLQEAPDPAEIDRLRHERAEVRHAIEDAVAARGILAEQSFREHAPCPH